MPYYSFYFCSMYNVHIFCMHRMFKLQYTQLLKNLGSVGFVFFKKKKKKKKSLMRTIK